MTFEEIKKVLKWDSSFAKCRLREHGANTLAAALTLELQRRRPRKRLVKWICTRIPTLS